MLAELAFASWVTVLRRSLLIAEGRCSPAEFERMLHEKLAAAGETQRRLAAGKRSARAVLSPWHRRARANAKRLRRK